MLRLIYSVNKLEIFGSLHSQAACDVITSLLDVAVISHTCESKNVVVASQLSALSRLWDVIVSICCKFISGKFWLSCLVLELQQPKTNLT